MKKIAARQTEFQKIPLEEAYTFVEEHHRQGLARPGKGVEAFGLRTKDTSRLVAVAIFSNPRTRGMNKRYTTELFRMAFPHDLRVMGGASKLIKGYIRHRQPWALFTYQDSSGEVTNVYTHAGMRLVTPAGTKEVLVKDGLTYAAARNNFRDWISREQAANRGPDALLGTHLGEVFREDGSRVNNVDLFLEHCGYHLETIHGDAVYEWMNPNVTHYTYRITADGDPGYYIGRRTIRTPNATKEECLSDPYRGSGGKKFQEWVESLGGAPLKKEILGVFARWDEVVQAERDAVGTLYLTDPNCMNYLPGGQGLGRSIANIRMAVCEVHGEGTFNGDSCIRCSQTKIFATKPCETHGLTLFRGDSCERCRHQKRYTRGACNKHGDVILRDGRCVNCSNAKALNDRHCPVHGLTLHQGTTCSRCNAETSVTLQECPLHGLVKHQGGKCCTCSSQGSVSLRECPVHGETKFQGDHCMRCNSRNQLQERECPTHGRVLHKGASCTLCTVAKALHEGECPLHGRVKFQGEVCTRCNAQKSVTMRECPTHGLTKHQGEVCNKCNAQKSVALGTCEVHGESKFQGGRCVRCRNAALITMKECPTHGTTKHRGKSCYACMADRRRKKSEGASLS